MCEIGASRGQANRNDGSAVSIADADRWLTEHVRLRDLRNLGPASERMLEAAGIRTPEQLDELGSVEAYRRVVDSGGHASMNLLWALEGALLGLDWRELPARRKQELRTALGQ